MTHLSVRLLLPAALLLGLSACGGDNAPSADSLTVTILEEPDSGVIETTYQTTAAFRPQLAAPGDLHPDEAAAFAGLNAERTRGGTCTAPNGTVTRYPAQPALKLEKHIYEAARAYAVSLRKRNVAGGSADHYDPADPDGQTPTRRMIRAGYKPLPPAARMGKLFFEENLAFGHATPAEAVQAWKTESFTHCQALYAPAEYGAVAVVDSPSGTTFKRYWVLNSSGVLPPSGR